MRIEKIFIFTGFLVFSLFGILKHEMWRDELQAWMLARDSGSVVELYQNTQYEGHPILWHLCLFGLSHITHDPLAMQLLHWVISLCIVYLILSYSPFALLHKFLLVFSYFIFFEYTIISRSYSLAVLFSFLFCAIYMRLKGKYFTYAIILALLANTSVYGLLLSVTLFTYIVLDEYNSNRFKSCDATAPFSAGQTKPTLAMVILALGWIISTFQVTRSKLAGRVDFAILDWLFGRAAQAASGSTPISPSAEPGFNEIQRASRIIRTIWESYFPLPPLFETDFWGANILTGGSAFGDFANVDIGATLALTLSVVLLIAVGYSLSQKRIVFWTYVAGNLLLFGLQLFVSDYLSIRHKGFSFILLIICFWLLGSRFSQGRLSDALNKKRRLASLLLTVILSGQLVAGVYAVGIDYVSPFSAGKAAANFIESEGFAELTIFGSRDRQASVLSGYLDVPIYYPERGEFGSFWTTHAPGGSEEQLLQEIDALVHDDSHHKILVALTYPLDSLTTLKTTLDFLVKFDQAIVENEVFYLYLAQGRI